MFDSYSNHCLFEGSIGKLTPLAHPSAQLMKPMLLTYRILQRMGFYWDQPVISCWFQKKCGVNPSGIFGIVFKIR